MWKSTKPLFNIGYSSYHWPQSPRKKSIQRSRCLTRAQTLWITPPVRRQTKMNAQTLTWWIKIVGHENRHTRPHCIVRKYCYGPQNFTVEPAAHILYHFQVAYWQILRSCHQSLMAVKNTRKLKVKMHRSTKSTSEMDRPAINWSTMLRESGCQCNNYKYSYIYAGVH